MIRKVTFSNFGSFASQVEIDLTASAAVNTDNSFVTSKSGDQVCMLAGIFGPNGAGKTTILKGIAFIHFFLTHSYQALSVKEAIPIDTYASRTRLPSFFKIEFESKKAIYRYEFSLEDGKITHEKISQFYPKTRSFRSLLFRKLTENGNLTLTQKKDFTNLILLKRLLSTRPNSSLLAAGLVTGRKEFKLIAETLGEAASNVGRYGKKDNGFQDQEDHLFAVSEFFYDNPEYFQSLSNLLKAADLGISGLEIRKSLSHGNNVGFDQVYVPYITHEGMDGPFELTLFDESSGTKRLFSLCAAIMPVLKVGGIALIDEMESDLHPHLIRLVLDLFQDPDNNPRGAQLLFACHHVEVLNQLAKEQIILVEKNEYCESKAYRLSDIKGVRREENFFANYNSGRYGAVPEPQLF